MIKRIMILAVISVMVACSNAPSTIIDNANNTDVGLSQPAVAMPDSYSADAAMQVLKEGGNAIDAAITAQFVLAVTLPEAGNVGGGGFMTIKFEDSTDFLDYREMAPKSAHRDMYLDQAGNDSVDAFSETDKQSMYTVGIYHNFAPEWLAVAELSQAENEWYQYAAGEEDGESSIFAVGMFYLW